MGGQDWRRAPVVYEIYPRSFQDSSGSGMGDLKGVTRRLSYVADLGVDAVWLCPFYVSPMHDGGYDVEDPRAVDPRMGTIEDFDALVETAHGLGLRVIIDQVFNHTSSHHPWFQAAIAGDDERAACYVFRDPKPDGTAPNNWLSQFGPPAWTWCHRRRQYYFHQFLECQPNLNLRHPEVQRVFRETLEFWKGRGVDGFRLDAVTSYLFDEEMPDNPPARPAVQDRVTGPNYNPYTYQDHRYDMLPGDGGAFCANIREWAGEDIYLLGESTTGNQSIVQSLSFTEAGRLDALYTTDTIEKGGSARGIVTILERLEGKWSAPFWFSCHDHPRHNTALGDGSDASAKFYALLLMALPGATLIYQGEELGLHQPELSYEEDDDPFDRLYWPDSPGRQGPRVPMPWEADTPEGTYGFTEGRPWLPMRWREGQSVAEQSGDGDSVLSFYRRAIAWRREAGVGRPDDLWFDGSDSALELRATVGDRVWHAVFNYSTDTALPVPRHQGAEPAIATGWDGRALAPFGAAVWSAEQ